jgi:sugar lactone lactonase YvrE
MTTGIGGAGAAHSAPVARPGSARRGMLTEGPRWDADRAELLWVDILAGELHTAAVGDDGHLEPVRTVQVGRPRPVAT